MRSNLGAIRATLVTVLLSLALSGCGRAEHGDASFCTYLNETSLTHFTERVYSASGQMGIGLVYQGEIVDGRLRALASAVQLNIHAGEIAPGEGRDQLLARCRRIRAL